MALPFFSSSSSPQRICLGLLGLGFALGACRHDAISQYGARPGKKNAASVVDASPRLTSIESPATDGLGREVRVACITCHGVRDVGANFPSNAADLKQFHVGLKVEHGALPCTSCHVSRTGGPPMLHLADGSTFPTSQAVRLCAQCHGPKYQDYVHGSHGGMNGYWDLSRGPRLRNHCVDCHDPHAPKFQPSRPVLPPKDRFLTPAAAEEDHE